MSVRLKLTLWYSGLLTVLLIAFGLAIYGVVWHNTMQEVKDRLRNVGDRMLVGRTISPGFPLRFDLRFVAPRSFDTATIGAQLVSYLRDEKGDVSDWTENLDQWGGIRFAYPDRNNVKNRFVERRANGYPFLVYERAVVAPETGELVGLLQVGAYIGHEQRLFAQLRTILFASGLAGVLAAFCLGMFLARQALRPIERVTEAAEQIQSGSELGLRIPREKADDEIGRLTDTLNDMLARLERAYRELEESNAAQRRFVSDASHELRTPLTTIRGNIDLLEKIWESGEPAPERLEMAREAIRDIADESRRMSRLVNDLLALARADAGLRIEREVIPILPVVREAARKAAFLPRTAGWRVGSLEALEGVRVLGNRDYLLQLLFILIENGFKYTPQGEVRLEAARREGWVGITVADTGIGMNQEEVGRIFQRFYRADESRGKTSGTGLGLSIAKWIIDMHEGALDVRTKPGEGSAFTLWLPVADDGFRPAGGCGIMAVQPEASAPDDASVQAAREPEASTPDDASGRTAREPETAAPDASGQAASEPDASARNGEPGPGTPPADDRNGP